MARIPGTLVVTALGGALLLPMLGSFGLWDPLEIQHADVAAEVARSGSFKDITLDGRFSPRPVLYVWLVAAGFKLFGVSEIGGRLPLAIAGILTLLCIFHVGRRLLSERAGMLAALVLATTPTFLFQSRQLASDVPLYLALACSVGGLAAFVWPVNGKRCRVDLLLGALGLVLGFLAGGLVIGTALPLLALALALALGRGIVNQGGVKGPDLDETSTLAGALRSAWRPLALALAGAGVAIAGLLATVKAGHFLLLGGEYRRIEMPPTFETVFRDLGFGFYPWIGLLPLALAAAFLAQGARHPAAGLSAVPTAAGSRAPRSAFPHLVVLVLVVGAYLVASFWTVYFGAVRYPALPWLALAVGAVLAERIATDQPPHRIWGVIAAGFILTLQQDFFMEPQSLAFSHIVGATPKYPIELNIKLAMRVFGILLALLFFLGLGGVPDRIKAEGRIRVVGPVVRLFARLLDEIGALLRWIGGAGGQRYLYAGVAVALVFAGWCAFYLTPGLSLHLSNKALFETFHSCRVGGEKLAQYQVAGRGAAYYNKGQVDEVRDQGQLFQMLREPHRWFVLLPTTYLASIDQAARQAQVTYHVLDERSSQYLIISNKLAGKCAVDRNPLRRYVLSKAPSPRKVVTANFENKVKLIGYDVDDTVTRAGKFKITLYFQVLSRMPAGYKVFLHFDQPANRFHGDHDPLGGKYPTQYWLPGDYIVDTHEVEIPLITTPSGVYTIYMGFWLGEGRLKVVEGPNDGVNRVQLGTVRVR